MSGIQTLVATGRQVFKFYSVVVVHRKMNIYRPYYQFIIIAYAYNGNTNNDNHNENNKYEYDIINYHFKYYVIINNKYFTAPVTTVCTSKVGSPPRDSYQLPRGTRTRADCCAWQLARRRRRPEFSTGLSV